MKELIKGKTALITGGTQGIGAEVSRLFIEQGATVVATDMHATDGQEVISVLGEAASYMYLDPADSDGWKIVVDAIMEDHGGLDIFVNNGSIWRFPSLENTSLEEYMSILRLCQEATFLGIRNVLPLLQQRESASIINISQLETANDADDISACASSRWAIQYVSRAAERELGQCGIRINSVHRGGDHVQVCSDRTVYPGCPEGMKDLTLRDGDVLEAARTVLYLASELSGDSTAGEYLVSEGLANY